MSIDRIGNRTCRLCGRPLTDATSRAFRIGPECRKGLTPEQLRASLQVAKQEADPFHVPEPRPASMQARINNHNARAAVTPEAVQLCRHENRAGACPDCRREADPHRAAERILCDVMGQSHAERRAERIAAQQGRYAGRVIAERPAPKPRTRPARRPVNAAASEQLELA